MKPIHSSSDESGEGEPSFPSLSSLLFRLRALEGGVLVATEIPVRPTKDTSKYRWIAAVHFVSFARINEVKLLRIFPRYPRTALRRACGHDQNTSTLVGLNSEAFISSCEKKHRPFGSPSRKSFSDGNYRYLSAMRRSMTLLK